MHPRVDAWAERLRLKPEFAKEIGQLRHGPEALDAIRRAPGVKTLEAVAGF